MINGTTVASLIARKSTEIDIFVPLELIETSQGELIEIRFKHLNPERPSEYSSTKDTRLLSVALKAIELHCLVQEPRDPCRVDLTLDAISDDGKKSNANVVRMKEMDSALKVYVNGNDRRYSTRAILDFYIRGLGATIHDLRKSSRDLINKRLREDGLLDPSETAFDLPFHLKSSVVAKIAPDLQQMLYKPFNESAEQSYEVFPTHCKDWADPQFPAAFRATVSRPDRPPFKILFQQEAIVYAHPFSYQVMDHKRRGTWLSASPQGLSRIIEFCPTVELRGNLVIAQDWFNGNNFAHFLFDWITRVGHFLMAGQTERYHDLFLLGGVSSEFHERILEAFGREFGLKRSQFLFPNKGENIVVSGKTYWFSDQVRTHMHPGQMMCESSVSLLQRLGRALSIKPGNGKRIYISREDASGRRPINEQELLTILERHGFKKVVFGNLALPDQWSTMFGAEFIVSPHGMGLTSLALHPGCPKVIELFNPKAGSDAYACVAHAMGFPYKYILGDTTPYPANDFYVDPRLLEQSLDDWGV